MASRAALGHDHFVKPATPTPKTTRQVARAIAERSENDAAVREARPLQNPNPWDALDPTKVAPDATPEAVHRRYLEFQTLCPPRPRKKHFL